MLKSVPAMSMTADKTPSTDGWHPISRRESLIDPGMPIGPLDAARYQPRAERTPARGGDGPDFRVTLSRELDGPPPELRGEVAKASRRWDELRAMGRELHFAEATPGGGVVVEVRDLEGRLLDTMPPSVALEVAAGAPLP